MNVLIVEDDAQVATFIAAAVESWGHHADTAESGDEAMGKISGGGWHLLLLDIYLPDVTADRLIPEIKTGCPKLPIITMTGKADEAMERAVRKTGIAYYMSKPVPMDELKQILDHMDGMAVPADAPRRRPERPGYSIRP